MKTYFIVIRFSTFDGKKLPFMDDVGHEKLELAYEDATNGDLYNKTVCDDVSAIYEISEDGCYIKSLDRICIEEMILEEQEEHKSHVDTVEFLSSPSRFI